MGMITIDRPLPRGFPNQRPKTICLHSIGEWIHLDLKIAKQLGIEKRDYYCIEFLEAIGYSAHGVISPNGLFIKCRETRQGAFHAKNFNEDSLGLEFMVPGLHTLATMHRVIENPWLPDPEFTTGVEVVRGWKDEYNIRVQEIYTHEQLSPERKKDPGAGFPLEPFLKSVYR